MLTHTITLESKEFGPLVGKTLTVRKPENLEDCRTLTVDGDADVVARFAEGIIRAQNNSARSKVARLLKKNSPEDTLRILQEGINAYRYTIREAGEPKVLTAKGKQTKVAASSGNRLFEKCLTDETFLARMVKQNVVDQAEFDDWKAARAEAERVAALPKVPKPAKPTA